VRQLPGPWIFFTSECQVADTPKRVSVERDGVLLVPGTRLDAYGNETVGWIAAEPATRRRLAWGLTQDEAFDRTRRNR
jgi:hypothetical protein